MIIFSWKNDLWCEIKERQPLFAPHWCGKTNDVNLHLHVTHEIVVIYLI